MKLSLVVFLTVFLSAALFSRDIKTLSGTTYKNAEVLDSNAIELIIAYKDKDLTVVKPVSFTDLPDDVRKEFKYDPVKSAAFEKERQQLENKSNESAKKKIVPQGSGQDILALEVQSEQDAEMTEVNIIKQPGITNGYAPGELEGAAEGRSLKRGAVGGYAPNELEGAAEGRSLKREAAGGGYAPNELEGAAEGRALKREAVGGGYAPNELEGAAEGRAMKREAAGGSLGE